MSKCMYTAQGDFVCQENKDTTEHFFEQKSLNNLFLDVNPYGNYLNSCKNCSFYKSIDGKSNLLKCNCLKSDYKTYNEATGLTNCFGKIENNNGNLECK